jgi:hypothetical protein
MSRTTASGWILTGCGSTSPIGTSDKRLHPKSPLFGRPRIGQFGIGKFATLSACERFVVLAQRGPFAAEVVFDKQAWEAAGDRWDLPVRLIPPDPARGHGTTVTLSRLRRRLDQAGVERRILESVPLTAPDFAVFLNGWRVMPARLLGHRLGSRGQAFRHCARRDRHCSRSPRLDNRCWDRNQGSPSHGAPGSNRNGGTGCAPDQGRGACRLSARNRRPHRVCERYGRVSCVPSGHGTRDGGNPGNSRPSFRSHRATEESTGCARSLPSDSTGARQESDLSPFGPVAYAQPSKMPGGGAGVLSTSRSSRQAGDVAEADQAKTNGVSPPEPPVPEPTPRLVKKRRRPRVRRLTPDGVVQRVRLGEAGVTCCLDHFGPDGREAFSEGSMIYINRDHPLYVRNSRRRETHMLHVARLLTQEISMMKDPRSPRQVFERQSKLLRDALSDDER